MLLGVVLLGVVVAVLRGAQPARADTSSDFGVVAGAGATTAAADGTSALDADLDGPSSVAVDAGGNIVVAETGRSVVDVIARSAANPGYRLESGDDWSPGEVFTIAGGGSTAATPLGVSAAAATLSSPGSVAFDGSGNLLIADTGHSLVDVLALSPNDPGYGIGSWSVGNLYVLAGGGSSTPSAGGTGALASLLNRPLDVVSDHEGDLLIADSSHKEVEVLAEAATDPGYVLGAGASWTEGDLYVVAGGGTSAPLSAGTVALATAIQRPDGLAVDASGNVAIGDSGNNNVDLLAVGASAVPEVLGNASRRSTGDLYVLVGSSDTVSPSTAGTSAVATSINGPVGPVGLAFDALGDLVIADSFDAEVEVLALNDAGARYVASAGATWTVGDLYVIGGGGSSMPVSAGTDATGTALDQPTGVAFGRDGALVVADPGSNLVEQLESAPSSPGAPDASVTSSSVRLSWSAPALDGGAPTLGYVIKMLSAGGATLDEITTGSPTPSASIADLPAATTYGFAIEAVNAIGDSTFSPETLASTAALDPTPSPLPSGSSPPLPGGTTTPPLGSDPIEIPAVRSPTPASAPVASAQVRLASDIAAVGTTAASIELDCTRAICNGSAELVARHRVIEHEGDETETFTETFVLGTRTFRLARGARRTIAIRLSASARSLLVAREAPVRTATLRIRVRGAKTLVKTVTIRMRPKRK